MVRLHRRSRVGRNGQVVIPKPIRDALGLHAGSEIFFCLEDGRVIVELNEGDNAWDRLLTMVKDKTPEPEQIDRDSLDEGRS